MSNRRGRLSRLGSRLLEALATPPEPAFDPRGSYPTLLRNVLAECYDACRATDLLKKLPPLELSCRWASSRMLRLEASPAIAADAIIFMLGSSWRSWRTTLAAMPRPAGEDLIELDGVDVVGIELVGCSAGPVTFLSDRASAPLHGTSPSAWSAPGTTVLKEE